MNSVRPNWQNPLLSVWASMEGEFHFDSTPIAPPGSEMLMHQTSARRRKTWYLGPCLNHYRKFRGVLPSTGTERLPDTVKFQHHAIGIPEITSTDRILEAAKQLDKAIHQVPKSAPMDTLDAIKALRELMLGKFTPDKLASTHPQRVPTAKPQRMTAAPEPAAKPQRCLGNRRPPAEHGTE